VEGINFILFIFLYLYTTKTSSTKHAAN